jgi:hypothetical protein
VGTTPDVWRSGAYEVDRGRYTEFLRQCERIMVLHERGVRVQMQLAKNVGVAEKDT